MRESSFIRKIVALYPPAEFDYPADLVDNLVERGDACLKFLEDTTVSAPRAVAFGIGSDECNQVGIRLILIEEMAGMGWKGQGLGGRSQADAGDLRNIWTGLARILAELYRRLFRQAGSLVPSILSEKRYSLSAIASDRFLVLSPWGPCNTEAGYYHGFVDKQLALIEDGQLYANFPVDVYLVFRFLKANTSSRLISSPSDNDPRAAGFFLKHADDKGDYLMVDDDLNITGIIDWQMPRVVPAAEAFGPSLVNVNMQDFCSGKVILSERDLALAACLREGAMPQLAETMSRDETLRHFFFELEPGLSLEMTLPFVRGLWTAFGIDGAATNWETWMRDAMVIYHDGRGLKRIIRRRDSVRP
ncbi:MAG: hypothetical protein M1817_005198 [Caeruleum heppii]|nr:MAG: hypothetical protein M1817_005198 [Caeruleum heppii]